MLSKANGFSTSSGIRKRGAPPRHLVQSKTPALTVRRKFMILQYKSEVLRNAELRETHPVGSGQWIRRLFSRMTSQDGEVSLVDVQRWCCKHPWIISVSDIPKGMLKFWDNVRGKPTELGEKSKSYPCHNSSPLQKNALPLATKTRSPQAVGLKDNDPQDSRSSRTSVYNFASPGATPDEPQGQNPIQAAINSSRNDNFREQPLQIETGNNNNQVLQIEIQPQYQVMDMSSESVGQSGVSGMPAHVVPVVNDDFVASFHTDYESQESQQQQQQFQYVHTDYESQESQQQQQQFQYVHTDYESQESQQQQQQFQYVHTDYKSLESQQQQQQFQYVHTDYESQESQQQHHQFQYVHTDHESQESQQQHHQFQYVHTDDESQESQHQSQYGTPAPYHLPDNSETLERFVEVYRTLQGLNNLCLKHASLNHLLKKVSHMYRVVERNHKRHVVIITHREAFNRAIKEERINLSFTSSRQHESEGANFDVEFDQEQPEQLRSPFSDINYPEVTIMSDDDEVMY